MDRLQEKLAKAGGVVARVTARIEARADEVIARETILNRRTEEAFVPHHDLLNEAEKGLDALEAQLALVSNDPLASSGSSQESTVATHAPIPEPSESWASLPVMSHVRGR